MNGIKSSRRHFFPDKRAEFHVRDNENYLTLLLQGTHWSGSQCKWYTAEITCKLSTSVLMVVVFNIFHDLRCTRFKNYQISLHYASEAAISLLPWLEKKREVMCSLMIGTSYFYESYFHSAFDYLWKTHRNTWQVRGVRARWSLPISCAQQLSQLIKPRGSFR